MTTSTSSQQHPSDSTTISVEVRSRRGCQLTSRTAGLKRAERWERQELDYEYGAHWSAWENGTEERWRARKEAVGPSDVHWWCVDLLVSWAFHEMNMKCITFWRKTTRALLEKRIKTCETECPHLFRDVEIWTQVLGEVVSEEVCRACGRERRRRLASMLEP